ncbi:unnamed protein product [Moneuplotes crassus]|uniref:Uncharacterized protein n=1 Tax=Euplotes crassus TaxID=5936 RepID=A0AAD2D397_EUPCR|nr:unnamed protein product [Moneuplotes crassus]
MFFFCLFKSVCALHQLTLYRNPIYKNIGWFISKYLEKFEDSLKYLKCSQSTRMANKFLRCNTKEIDLDLLTHL